MMWAFTYLLNFIKHRGAGRHRPIGLVIDELTELTNFESLGVDLFAKDLDELINVYARNCGIWLTIAHQEAFQVSERTLKTLMTMGTQILGVTSDMEAALSLARQFFPVDPYRAKRWENVWMSDLYGPYVIEERPVEFTVEEQLYLSAEYFRRLGLFEFLVRPAAGEGNTIGRVHSISIRNYDHGQWVIEHLAAQARSMLAERTGVPVEAVLAAIEDRSRQHSLPKSRRSVTISDDEQFYDPKPGRPTD